ncbi:MAG TPA: hypothetical protein VG389_23525 [Myxococcota bacterium]|nr:hypothetical protein [Myxococcota bacterium]
MRERILRGRRRASGWVAAAAALAAGVAAVTPSGAGTAVPPAAPAAATRPFHKGMAVGLYSEGKKHGTYDDALVEVKAIGVRNVSFVVQWTMDSIRDLTIRPTDGDTVPDARLIDVMKKARSLGMDVFLFPIVHVVHRKPLEWRGVIKPTDPDAWWAEYETFLLHYAHVAADAGIGLMSIGSELVSLEGERARFEKLIAKVRAVYKGRLIYSANWDHYRPVTFWDLLDYVGMTGYHAIAKSTSPSLEELKAGWGAVKKDIVEFARSVGRPVIFTEIGYPSQDGAAMHPWDYTTSDPVDLDEQYLCYRAFYEVWKDEPMLGGVYFWNWWGRGGPTDGWYTPKGKPAEKVVREWYLGPGK